VTKGMRVNALPLRRGPIIGQMLAQEVTHTESANGAPLLLRKSGAAARSGPSAS
jgi:hypothetical protein